VLKTLVIRDFGFSVKRSCLKKLLVLRVMISLNLALGLEASGGTRDANV
jgi:hypothetical protein